LSLNNQFANNIDVGTRFIASVIHQEMFQGLMVINQRTR
jgi:hypothetical protein